MILRNGENDPEKDRKALVTYVELNGYKHGEIGKNHLQTCHNGISEKLSLDQIAANFGRDKNNEAKQRKVALEYVKLCGYEQGGDRKSNGQSDRLKLSEIGGSAKKVGKRIKELERLYGIKVGKPNYEKNSQLKTQAQLASDMGMDVRTLQNYKMLAEMIPELEKLLDTGIVTKTTG